MKRTHTKEMLFASLMAALIAVCSWISIPFTVPFTLQTFGIYAALLLLGRKWGTVSVCIYLLVGFAGAPVFAGFRGGIGVLSEPAGGFIIGFVLLALCYIPFEIHGKRVTGLTVGTVICYTFGTVWFRVLGYGTGVWDALVLCVIPFILPDAVKLFLAYKLSERVKKRINF